MNLLSTEILKIINNRAMSDKKKHADFQDEYRKSSNFGKTDKADELNIKGDGELKLEKDKKMKAMAERKKIENTLNKIISEEE